MIDLTYEAAQRQVIIDELVDSMRLAQRVAVARCLGTLPEDSHDEPVVFQQVGIFKGDIHDNRYE